MSYIPLNLLILQAILGAINGAAKLDGSGHVQLSELSGITTSQLDPAAGIVAGQIASVNPSALTGSGTIPDAALPAEGTAGTTANPGSVTVDAKGRVTAISGGGGTVMSVGLSAPSVLSVSGSPVTASGTLALAFASGQTQNEVLATPNGSSGAVGLRALVAADIPAHATTHDSGGSDVLYFDYGHNPTTRIEVMPRHAAAALLATATQTVGLSYVTPPFGLTITGLTLRTGSTAATSATLVKVGIYTVDGSGNLTLVAQSADLHTTAFIAASTNYTLAITLDGSGNPISNYALVRGTRYAFGVLIVTTGTLPTLVGANGQGGILTTLAPTMSALRTGQSSLPASIAVGNLSGAAGMYYFSAA